MYDFEPERKPLTRGEKWTLAVFACVILGGFGLELTSRFEPAKLSIPFMVAFWLPLVALHEAGHACVARGLGWRVEQLVVGFGRTVWRRRIAGVPVELRAVPLEGFVRCSPRRAQGARTRQALIYFAGPGIELLLALALLLVVGPERLLTPSDVTSTIALQSLALAAVLGGVLNLIPHSTIGPDGEIPNDGLGILWSLSLPDAHFARRVAETEATARDRR